MAFLYVGLGIAMVSGISAMMQIGNNVNNLMLLSTFKRNEYYDTHVFWPGGEMRANPSLTFRGSSGTVNNFTILESADLNKIADIAKKMSSTYKEPGK